MNADQAKVSSGVDDMHARILRWFAFLCLGLALGAQDLRIQVLCTTDLHSHVMPEDPFTLQPQAKGWAKLATLIKERKAQSPHTLLVDCGDNLQGDPIAYIRHRVRPDLPDPTVTIMNALGYHAMTVGNHEFDFGQPLLRALEEKAQFPFLSANTVDTAQGRPAFTPYVIQEFAGVRVAVLGLTTSATPMFQEPSHLAGLRFRDPVEAAQEWIPRLRDKERADVVIVALHGGLGEVSSHGYEDQGLALADRVPGVDLLLLGHSHQTLQTTRKGVQILQAGAHGRTLGAAMLTLRQERGRWRLSGLRTELIPCESSTELDFQVLQLTKELRAAAQEYLDTPATQLQTDLDGRWARMEDSAIAQLLHTVQRQATGAQLSAVAPPRAHYFVPAGPTSVRQFFALMPYENRVARIRITGAQLKAWLEHSARAYNFSWEPELFNKSLFPHDQDLLDGCSYALDLGKPLGQRVRELKVQGQPVRSDQEFTLATTTYRLAGGGGYLKAIGWRGTPEFISQAGLRNLLLDYVLNRPTLTIPLSRHWRTIPYLDRERVFAQQ